tara:strand:+ start:939 stop:1766 length:828 start_codon:yes stop_codon:yes gene_type:complete
MTLQAVETSRQQTNNRDNQSGTREFLVFEDDESQPQPTLQQAVSSTGVRLFTRDQTPVLGRLIPLEVNVSTDLEAFGKFKVNWKYGLEDGGFDTSPGDPSFIDFSISQRPVAVDTFRVAALNDPIVAPGTGNVQVDIGGIGVDSAGDPVTRFVNQQELSVTVRSESFNNIPIALSLNFLGKRNLSPYLGAQAGFLLYTGLSVQRDGVDSYNTTLNFVFDEDAHRRQVPQRDVNGTIIPENKGTSSEPKIRAKTVHMIQPFPELVNFQNLGVPNPV